MPSEKQLKYWESLKGKPTWNKGKVGVMKPNKTSFKKNHPKPVNAYSYQPGYKMSDTTKAKIGHKLRGSIHSIFQNKQHSIVMKGKLSKEKNPNWKGGITPKREQERKRLEVKLWRKACFERDNFTCQKYGVRTGGLVVHHINNFAEFPDLQTAIDNGITLSKTAHKEFHDKYGYRHNTKGQLLEFLQAA